MKKEELDELLTYYDEKFKCYKPKKVVHYCTIDTFYKIVEPYINKEYLHRIDDNDDLEYEAKAIRFFATDLLFLNDKAEYKLGKEIVEHEAGITGTSGAEALYLACFCDDSDSLTQWKYYGKDYGLAVEFDTEDVMLNYCDICGCNDPKKTEKYPRSHDIAFMPFNVYYCDLDSYDKEYIKKLLPTEEELRTISLETAKLGLIPYIKHKAFKDEHESRITLYHCETNGKNCSSNKLRSSGVIKPYIEMRIFYGNKKAQKLIPIKSVTIGPCRDQSLVFTSVYHLLEEDYSKKGIDVEDLDFVTTSGGIKIIKSKVPFRS